MKKKYANCKALDTGKCVMGWGASGTFICIYDGHGVVTEKQMLKWIKELEKGKLKELKSDKDL